MTQYGTIARRFFFVIVDKAYHVRVFRYFSKADQTIASAIEGKTIVKEISVPNKIVNIVVR